MTLSNILFFIMATIGLTNVIVESTIAEFIRDFWKNNTSSFVGNAIDCHQCVGWWSGLFCSLVFLRKADYFDNTLNIFIIMIFSAFASSFVCTLEKVIRNYFIENTVYIMCKSIQDEDEDEH